MHIGNCIKGGACIDFCELSVPLATRRSNFSAKILLSLTWCSNLITKRWYGDKEPIVKAGCAQRRAHYFP